MCGFAVNGSRRRWRRLMTTARIRAVARRSPRVYIRRYPVDCCCSRQQASAAVAATRTGTPSPSKFCHPASCTKACTYTTTCEPACCLLAYVTAIMARPGVCLLSYKPVVYICSRYTYVHVHIRENRTIKAGSNLLSIFHANGLIDSLKRIHIEWS